ncbi:MAG: polysaccharide deacetylase family protein, partial [Dongiaceae bacterium]
DDAVSATPALRRLFDTAVTAAGQPLPLALAVIPVRADGALARALHAAHHTVALQHGYAHTNQAAATAKKAEFGVGRNASLAMQELRDGSQRMRGLLADGALPVLVPPWNRIDPALTGRLAELGIRGLSTYGPRAAKATVGGTIVVNTHVDIINWRDGRRFLGVEGCLRLAIDHLAARREGRVDPEEPTGLLTHHLVHDADAWAFLLAFLQRTSRHPAARWMDARQLFGCSNGGPA